MCLRWEVLAATTAEICNTSGRDSDLETCEFSGSLTFPKVATFNELALLSKSCHLLVFVLELPPSSSLFRNSTKAFEAICVHAMRSYVAIKDTFSLSGPPMPCY